MADPTPAGTPASRADESIVQRRLYEAARGVICGALTSYRFSAVDREDLVQEVILRAWTKRATYRASRGTLAQWLSAIARNAAADLLRAQGKDPASFAGPMPEDPPHEAPTPEETVTWSQLAELANHVFDLIPEKERRVVILHAIELHSFHAIAEIEKIAPSTAKARYDRGMAKLRRADQEGKLDGAILRIPGDPGPPDTPEAVERGWQRFQAAMGRDLDPDSEPPPSGPRRVAPAGDAGPPSTRPPGGQLLRLRKLGPLLAVFAGAGPAAGVSPASEPPAVVLAEVSPVAPSIFVGGVEPPMDPAPASGPPSLVPTMRASGPRPAVPTHHENNEERQLLDQARRALQELDPSVAVKVLDESARQFPRGQSHPMYERAWAQVCARHRRIHLPGAVPELDKRCTGR